MFRFLRQPVTAESFTVEERLAQVGRRALARLEPRFVAAGLDLPLEQLALAAFKDRRVLELYGRRRAEPWRFLLHYPIRGASGTPGPKLREGDRQVPEGLYRVERLNPNSRFHLALRLDYPNALDRAMGAREGRYALGGDIMIHGGDQTIGCLAMGDEAAEDLFTLAAMTGIENIRVVLSPVDFRETVHFDAPASLPDWTHSLYAQLRAELKHYPRGL
ncbi:MAG: L,D-transpeptidase family protein [Gammaproteobacteria bacterium]